MRYRQFRISNFRGIQSLKLDLPLEPSVITLVGLNESGKTTVLEALNYSSFNPESLDALSIKGYSIKDPHTLIPIAKKSNFNGTTVIEVDVELDESDHKAISAFLKKELAATQVSVSDKFTITQRTVFTDSRHNSEKSRNTWAISIGIKKKGKRAFAQLKGEDWIKAFTHLKKLLPPIIYFPTFTLDIPEKIYLDSESSTSWRTCL